MFYTVDHRLTLTEEKQNLESIQQNLSNQCYHSALYFVAGEGIELIHKALIAKRLVTNCLLINIILLDLMELMPQNRLGEKPASPIVWDKVQGTQRKCVPWTLGMHNTCNVQYVFSITISFITVICITHACIQIHCQVFEKKKANL